MDKRLPELNVLEIARSAFSRFSDTRIEGSENQAHGFVHGAEGRI